jgi:hypothetical protein
MAAFFKSRSYDFVSKVCTGGVPGDLVLCNDLVVVTLARETNSISPLNKR